MLYDPLKHEAVDNTPWHPELALATIRKILEDTDRAFAETTFWPPHPDDDEPETAPMSSLFNGASSTAWALLYFANQSIAPTYQRDYRQVLSSVYQTYIKNPDMGTVAPGYLFGETGILAVLESAAPRNQYSVQLDDAIDRTMSRPENELMWGASGALVAATLLYEKSGKQSYHFCLLKLPAPTRRDTERFQAEIVISSTNVNCSGCHKETNLIYTWHDDSERTDRR